MGVLAFIHQQPFGLSWDRYSGMAPSTILAKYEDNELVAVGKAVS